MPRPGKREAVLHDAGHSRSARQAPFALRLLVAVLFAAIIALGASFLLRVLNL